MARRGGAQEGWTPLFIAADNGHDDVVAALLAAGAALDAKMQARHSAAGGVPRELCNASLGRRVTARSIPAVLPAAHVTVRSAALHL